MSQQAQAMVQKQPGHAQGMPLHRSVFQRAAVIPAITAVHSGILQRCSGGVECEECRRKRLEREGMMQRAAVSATPVNDVPPIVHEVLSSSGQPLDAGTRAFMEPRFGHDFSQVRVHTSNMYQSSLSDFAIARSRRANTPEVQRQRGGSSLSFVSGTNYAFDTFRLTESHLSDPEIISRFNALSKVELMAYRDRVTDPAVRDYIDRLIATRTSVPCTPFEASQTSSKAEAARVALLPFVPQARIALDRLHSLWITHKSDLLAGRRTLEGQIVCAFNSNFNITQTDPHYGVRQIVVMQQLRHLESLISHPVAYACQPADDPVCAGVDRDTIAYVRNGRPPIHFCPQFRDDPDLISQQATVVHEYTHLLPGVHDRGGYALGGFGAQVTTCAIGLKFTATSDVLTYTADALAGFIMHIAQYGAEDIHVR